MKINFKNSSVIIFIAIALLYAIGNFIWWKLNTPIYPQGICALHFMDIFQQGYLYTNAPLITWIMKFMFYSFGTKFFDLQIICVNYIFFLIALVFIYKLGIEFKSKETGVLAMILFALTPCVYGLSRQYGHKEWHVMCAMIINIYFLIKSNNFENKKWSVLYGISVGVGLLIKDEFLAYFFVPWLYVVIRSLIYRLEKQKIINILITVFLGSLISGYHYFRIDIINKIIKEPVTETFPIFSACSLRVVSSDIFEMLVSIPIFIFFIFGFLYVMIEYKNKYKYILLLWILIPWLIIFCMPHHKLPEYEMGFVPAIILMSAIYLSNIKRILLKNVLIYFVVLILILQFIDFSYGIDMKIFDFKINLNNINLCYYNKNKEGSTIMVYKKNKYMNSLIRYFKDNFINDSIYIYHLMDKEIVAREFCLNMILYTKQKVYIYIDDMIKFLPNIVVYSDAFDIKDMENLTKLEKDLYDIHLWNFNDAIDKLKEFNRILNSKYMIIDEFYLDESNKTKENHMIILGKKEIFENMQLKYKYKNI